jgi:hypothetical protein
MRDDGVAPDVSADDGVYTGSALLAGAPGDWTLHATALADGFERVESAYMRVGDPGWAALEGSLVETTTATGGGRVSAWGYRAPITASVDGTYVVIADLVDAAGNLVSQPTARIHLGSGESTSAIAWVRAADLARSVAATGPLGVTDVRLFREGEAGQQLVARASGFATRQYGPDSFDWSGVALDPVTPDPSPTGSLVFTGFAIHTPARVSRVEYTLNKGATWSVATPSDGAFDSTREAFHFSASFADGLYAVAVRLVGSDGAVTPLEEYGADRFIVDRIAPLAVSGLMASGGVGQAVAWSAPEVPDPAKAAVYYEIAIDGTLIATTYEPSYSLPQGDAVSRLVRVTPVDEAGNRGPSAEIEVVQ